MAAATPTPEFGEQLLDAYALIFARMALDRLMAEQRQPIDDDQPAEECADANQN